MDRTEQYQKITGLSKVFISTTNDKSSEYNGLIVGDKECLLHLKLMNDTMCCSIVTKSCGCVFLLGFWCHDG